MNSNDFNNTQKFNLINSNEVKNNDLIKSQEFNFNFIGTKFLWKELMKLNTKYIERSGDISSITPYVQNILCSRLTQDNIDMLSEEYIIQLVTLLQLTGQYLVYTQKMLEEENERLMDENSYLKNNLTENEKYSKIIEDLNRQNQEKDFLIKTYQDMIQTNGINNIDLNNNKNSKTNSDFYNSKKKYYYCSLCSGKKFISQKYLDEHIERRHYNQKDLIRQSGQKEEEKVQEKKNYRQQFEDKLNLMMKDFELKMKQQEENNDFVFLLNKMESLKDKMLQQNLNNTELINGNNINYQNSISYQQNIERNEKKETSSNKEHKKRNDEYKKKYEETKKKYDELKKILDNDYMDLLKKYNEQEKKLNELQNLHNNIDKDKSNRIPNEYINNNTDIKRSNIKYNTSDYNKMKPNENENKIQNNINNMKQNNHNMENSELKNYNEGYKSSGGKIFDNRETSTPMGDEIIKNQKEKNSDKNSNNNNIQNSDIFASKNVFISKNIDQDKNEKLKAFDTIKTNMTNKNQNVLNSININNNSNNNEISQNGSIPLTISKFRKAYEERDENFNRNDDYNQIKIPEKYKYNVEQKIEDKKEEIKAKLNNSISSNNVKKLMEEKNNRDSIYKKYYDKLNEALNLENVLNSYNKYQKEKNKNQMIVGSFSKVSSINNDNEKNIHEGTFHLKASNNPNMASENPYSNRPSQLSKVKEFA